MNKSGGSGTENSRSLCKSYPPYQTYGYGRYGTPQAQAMNSVHEIDKTQNDSNQTYLTGGGSQGHRSSGCPVPTFFTFNKRTPQDANYNIHSIATTAVIQKNNALRDHLANGGAKNKKQKNIKEEELKQEEQKQEELKQEELKQEELKQEKLKQEKLEDKYRSNYAEAKLLFYIIY